MKPTSQIKGCSRSLKTKPLETDFLTTDEVAALLRVSVKTIYRLTARGDMPCRCVGGQKRYFKPDLDRWFKGDNYENF